MNAPADQRTPLACLYHWEKTAPDVVHFTQPVGKGQVVEYTWRQLMDEVRRMAAYLKGLGLPPGSQVAILAKNTAHWIMADYAIWMAGHVSVPLYPTLNADTVQYILEHSDSKLLFVGKLDEWDDMKAGVPKGLPIVRLPMAPDVDGAATWEGIVAKTAPLQGEPDRDLESPVTIIYTSGSTGRPKGVVHGFRAFNACGLLMVDVIPASNQDRMLSYLPLAHVAERMVVQNNST
jgi:long-subunit acyl-CoA synthetase (AMP-forming)